VVAVRWLGALLATVVVTLTATGWMYVLGPQSTIPGPRLADVLPLDELAKHSSAPVAVVVVVWAAAGCVLGLIARSTRLDRLAVALLLALWVAAIEYVADALSIAVVRQIPMQQAFDRAAAIPALFVAAALAGLGGATFARARVGRTRAADVLVIAVAFAGVLDIVRAVLPGSHELLVTGWAPDKVTSVAAALGVPVGVGLLFAARGLARRLRRAWLIAVGLLVFSVSLHVLHGFNDGGVLATVTLVALVAARREFGCSGDPESRSRLLVRGVTSAAAVTAFGVAAIWVNRTAADRPFSIGFALHETLRSADGVGGSPHLGGPFGGWFPLAVVILSVLGLVWTLSAALAPWRYRHQQDARERELARDLVTAWGSDTLAPFVLRADKSYFFADDELGFVAYKVVGGVAIVSGDPIGPPDGLDALIVGFIAFARARGWRVAIIGASERNLDAYRRHGLLALYHGDEAVLDTGTFSLEGRPIRKVRQSVQRLAREGYVARLMHPREIDAELRADLEAIARDWRGDEPQKGFVMALDTLFRLEDEDAVFAIGFDPQGRPAGFIHFACSRAGAALSLSSMPRLRSTPNGFNEWLVCETADWARENGFRALSLNFAPFAALLAPEADLSALQRVERRALLSLKGHFQLDNLLLFNRKFFPAWQRRFVVYESRLDLPRVGIAALAAEAYLPQPRRRRE